MAEENEMSPIGKERVLSHLTRVNGSLVQHLNTLISKMKSVMSLKHDGANFYLETNYFLLDPLREKQKINSSLSEINDIVALLDNFIAVFQQKLHFDLLLPYALPSQSHPQVSYPSQAQPIRQPQAQLVQQPQPIQQPQPQPIQQPQPQPIQQLQPQPVSLQLNKLENESVQSYMGVGETEEDLEKKRKSVKMILGQVFEKCKVDSVFQESIRLCLENGDDVGLEKLMAQFEKETM